MSVSRFTVNGTKTGVNIQYAPKAASTAITPNSLVTRDANGRLIPAVPASTYIAGVAIERVASTDPDFAATTDIAFDEPREGDQFVMAVDDTATSGFVPGVTRTIVNATTVKAAAIAGGEEPLVRVHRILSATSAVVSFITQTNRS